MMYESYTWASRIKRLSPQQIKQMKEHMRKVPLIQAKSDHYHQTEAQQAESLLDQVLQSSPDNSPPQHKDPQTNKLSWFQKIKKYLFW